MSTSPANESPPRTASSAYKSFAAMPAPALEEVFLAGGPPSAEAIIDWEFRGYNHSPRLVDAVRLRKFIKGFFRSPSGQTFGYNTPVVQNGLDGEWLAKPRDDAPTRFRFYRLSVVEHESHGPDNKYPGALLLDYSRAGNPRFAIYRGLRNYMRQAERGSDDLLICKAYFAVGRRRPQVNFFLLERHRRIAIDPLLADRPER